MFTKRLYSTVAALALTGAALAGCGNNISADGHVQGVAGFDGCVVGQINSITAVRCPSSVTTATYSHYNAATKVTQSTTVAVRDDGDNASAPAPTAAANAPTAQPRCAKLY